MITVEIQNAEQAAQGLAEVEIFCDAEGLASLIKQLEHLKGGSSHVHLMTSAWAGNELGEQALGERTALVNHLRITTIPKN